MNSKYNIIEHKIEFYDEHLTDFKFSKINFTLLWKSSPNSSPNSSTNSTAFRCMSCLVRFSLDSVSFHPNPLPLHLMIH